jgi:hypothetical protein
MKGRLSLALQWCGNPLIIEMVCLEILKFLNNEGVDRPVYTSMIDEIKTLMKVRHACIAHVKISQNTSSNYLANYARIHACTMYVSMACLWFRGFSKHMPY